MTTLDILTKQIIRLEMKPLDGFAAHAGTADLNLVWNPKEDQLARPPQQQLLGLWRELAGKDARPQFTGFSPHRLHDVLSHLHVIEYLRDRDVLWYRRYGPAVAARYGRDSTGQVIANEAAGMALLFNACYHAVLKRGHPLYVRHLPPEGSFVRHCERLIVPLYDDHDENLQYVVLAHYPNSFAVEEEDEEQEVTVE